MRHEILIVDDSEDIRLAMRLGLADLDAAIAEAGTAAEAYDALRTRPVSVVLLDLSLPDASGAKAIGEVRRLAADVHLIVVTASASEDVRLRCFAAGADDFVTKPFGLAELAARVGVGLRRRRSASEGLLSFGSLELDLNGRVLRIAGVPVALDEAEYDLVSYLVLHPGRTFREDHLAVAVSGGAGFDPPASIMKRLESVRAKLASVGASEGWFAGGVSGLRFDPYPGRTRAPSPLAAAVRDTGGPVALIVGRGSRVIDVTNGALDFFGAVAPEELVGTSVIDLVAEVSVAAIADRAARAQAGDWPEPETLYFRRLDEVPIAAEIVSRPVERDGVEAAELSLWPVGTRRSEALQSVLLGVTAEVSDAVVITDADFCVRSFNPAAERLTGWSEAEATGSPVVDVMPWIAGSTMEEAGAALTRDGTWTGQVVTRTRSGDEQPVRITLTALRDLRGSIYSVVAVIRPHAEDRTRRRHQLLDEIAGALRSNRIVPHYQPIVRLHDGRVTGLEALARWHRDDGSVVAAAEFMPEVEQSELMVEFGRAILRRACADAERWGLGPRNIHLAVNVGALQLLDPDLANVVARCIEEHGLGLDTLWLEVTESSLVEDLEQAERALRGLVEAGASVAIDDFGTGWASLTYLRQFPVSALKIDKGFVESLGTGTNDEAIVRSILRLAEDLDLEVVAEGIETAYQRRALRALGCTLGQGYLFGHPAPEPALD